MQASDPDKGSAASWSCAAALCASRRRARSARYRPPPGRSRRRADDPDPGWPPDRSSRTPLPGPAWRSGPAVRRWPGSCRPVSPATPGSRCRHKPVPASR